MGRILFLTQVLPFPLDAGPKVRAYYVLRHLAQRHEVTLVSFVRAEDQPEHLAHLAQFCSAVHSVPMHRSRWRTARAGLAALLTGEPVVIVRDRSAAMQSLLRTLTATQAFDAVHADQTAMVQYALYAKERAVAFGQPRPHLVLDAHNAFFKVVARLAGQAGNGVSRRVLLGEAERIRRYEGRTYRQFDDVVFVIAEDRAEFDLAHAHVIPICGDPQDVAMVERRSTRRCTFVGALHWPPNAEGIRWFLRDVWPSVHMRLPDLNLTVIGKQPPRDLVETPPPNTEVLGYVADLAPFLAETGVFIVPLFSGGGMRVKIVDAWTWGLPVVSTRIGAEGMCYEDGDNLLIADEPAAFAEAIVRVLCDPELAERLRRRGRQTALTQYSWQTTYSAWDAIYPYTGAEVVQQGSAARQFSPA